MAYLYFDDDSPFAEEFENNYIYFDEKDPEAFRLAIRILKNPKLLKYFSNREESSDDLNSKATTDKKE